MGRKILITGASKGIGLVIAQELVKNDYTVVGLARDFSNTNLKHKNFETIEVDLSDLDGLPAFLKSLVKDHGDIGGLILNAGKGLMGNLEQYSYSQMRELINLNLLSATYVVKAFISNFRKAKSGDIIFISSTSGLRGHGRAPMYCASKFGLRGFAQSMREDCIGDNIRVCTINPGVVKTPFFDDLYFTYGDEKENYVEPEDIAITVKMVLEMRSSTVMEEITIAPQRGVIKIKEKEL